MRDTFHVICEKSKAVYSGSCGVRSHLRKNPCLGHKFT